MYPSAFILMPECSAHLPEGKPAHNLTTADTSYDEDFVADGEQWLFGTCAVLDIVICQKVCINLIRNCGKLIQRAPSFQ
jgi:hypothetical protein